MSAPALSDPVPRVVVQGAVHAYGERRVLNGVDLSVKAGEIYGLLGPNGAGKTTLMRAIAGRLRLTSGSVRTADDRRAVGYVPQDIAVYPHLTVRENLEVLARFAGLQAGAIKASVARVMADAALSARADQICGTLSGGFQRRVNICASLLHDPAVLVLDEPTVGIDIEARDAVHGLLQQLRQRGTALVLSTHDLDQAELICDRVGVMVAGRLLVEGAPSALISATFGEDQEVVIALRQPASDHQVPALMAEGLAVTDAPLLWIGRAPARTINVAALSQSLEDAGLQLREVRVRKPDLAALFRAVLDRAGAP